MNEGVQAMILFEMEVVYIYIYLYINMIRTFLFIIILLFSITKKIQQFIYIILNFHAYFPPLVCCFLAKDW